MNIAEFMPVSQNQFEKDWALLLPALPCPSVTALPLPKRGTKGSAGYDFALPCALELPCGESVTIPTGMRAKMQPGWVLLLFVRSSLGFRYRLQLDNTVGVIDQDYFFASNEGHILIKLTNDGKEDKTLVLPEGHRFAQGVFVPFGLAKEEETETLRTGGLGSTDQK